MGYMEPEGSIAGISGRPFSVLLGAIIVPSIATLFVAARWFVRIKITHALRFDDVLALLTLFSNIAYCVLIGLATRPDIGVGQHIYDFPQAQESEYYKWVYIYDTFYITSLLGYKTTILCLYLRVFGIRKHFKWLCWAVLFVVDGYLVASFIVQLAGCNPPHKFWDKDVVGYCIDDLRFDIAYGCLNVITDFIIALLPLREIWRLFMPAREKMWASVIFGSAILAFGTAIASQTYRFHDLFSDDRTYNAAVTFTWQNIEINTGLICSCTPTLRPLYRKTIDSLTRTFSGSSRSSKDEALRDNIQRDLDGDGLHVPPKGSKADKVYSDRKGNNQLNPVSPGGNMTHGEYMIAEKLGPDSSSRSEDNSPDRRNGRRVQREAGYQQGRANGHDRDLDMGIGLSEQERRERIPSAPAPGEAPHRTMSGETIREGRRGEAERGGHAAPGAEEKEVVPRQERYEPGVVPRENAGSRQRWLNDGASHVQGNEDSLVLNNEARAQLERDLENGVGLAV